MKVGVNFARWAKGGGTEMGKKSGCVRKNEEPGIHTYNPS